MLKTEEVIGFNRNVNIPRFKVGDILTIKYESRKGYWAVKTFTGICIAKKNLHANTKIILRNVLDGISVEYNFFLYGQDILEVHKVDKKKDVNMCKSKLYYLRFKNLNKSKV